MTAARLKNQIMKKKIGRVRVELGAQHAGTDCIGTADEPLVEERRFSAA
jgi:hypothetical protein